VTTGTIVLTLVREEYRHKTLKIRKEYQSIAQKEKINEGSNYKIVFQ
jgi:hypothetical protein